MDPVTRLELVRAISSAFGSTSVSSTQLIEAARTAHARKEVLETLSQVDPDDSFRTVRDLWTVFPEMPVDV
uniref:DUF2795 domain-containing protein n=1 Tax=Brevibacterium sp. Ap13 TaxID=1406197 RepID=U5NZ69_9MICO|nr:DUF2795 domain-containing protein [Brevibacterium sp. Ap13]AGY35339.1 hypothetical protein AP13_p00300 [Brevibacterium sp. Ap13]